MTTFAQPEQPEKVIIPSEGGLWSVPLGTTIEYGATSPLPANAIFHGIITEDGVSQTSDRSTTEHRGWAGGRIYRTTIDEATVTFTTTLVETTDANSELYFGKGVNSTTGGTHVDAGVLGAKRQFIIIGEDVEQGRIIKQWIPEGQVTETGDRTFNRTDATGYEITITAYSKQIEGEFANFVEWVAPTQVDPYSS